MNPLFATGARGRTKFSHQKENERVRPAGVSGSVGTTGAPAHAPRGSGPRGEIKVSGRNLGRLLADSTVQRRGRPGTSSSPAPEKVTVLVDGRATRAIRVSGSPTLYRLTDDKAPRTARLELGLDEGLQAYAFTFG
ncbi:hypothetical protein [Streptomyces cyaneofuscatus]|uniref:hypothetical protein n=1 Tax=Streptomyces cyaneofuscatus TaxID=66883 RepID=UPI0036BFB0F8